MFGFMRKSNNQVIHVNDLDNLIGKIELIDIREPYEYRTGSLKTAKNIPMRTLLENPAKYLNKEQTYYIVCQSGGRSANAVRLLDKQGYQVVNVAGGVGSYAGTKRS